MNSYNLASLSEIVSVSFAGAQAKLEPKTKSWTKSSFSPPTWIRMIRAATGRRQLNPWPLLSLRNREKKWFSKGQFIVQYLYAIVW